MVTYIDTVTFLQHRDEGVPVLDIRSPGEFAQGHMPSALSFPIFSNEEREIIGTLYKQSGKEKAFHVGLDIVGPNMSKFVKKATSYKSKTLLLYCWRGGKRSESMAWLLSQAGFNCYVLTDGYKAYRNYIREILESYTHYIVLGGMTGSNKTGILKALRAKGEQVIDLEGLAHHRGSAFGHIGEPEQPTTETFENILFEEWRTCDKSQHIWLEDESRSIGKVVMPDCFYKNKKNAFLLVVEVPKSERIKHLVREYTGIDDQYLHDSILRISKRLGGDRTRECLDALHDKNYDTVADMSLAYYDKAYGFSITNREKDTFFVLPLQDTSPDSGAEEVLKWYRDFHQKLK